MVRLMDRLQTFTSIYRWNFFMNLAWGKKLKILLNSRSIYLNSAIVIGVEVKMERILNFKQNVLLK
jgi:hypothetical protein